MKFKQWIAEQIGAYTETLDGAKAALKDAKALKAALVNSKEDTSHINIFHFENRVTTAKLQLEKLKKLQKVEVVRLKTGAVIAFSTLRDFNKKVSGRMRSAEITQHPDGLKLSYTDGTTKGHIAITGFGVNIEIPADVELPIYSEGEILECLLRS